MRESDDPFFIVGNPRSGTTLLRLLLSSHPALHVPPECGFAIWLMDKYREVPIRDERVLNNFLADLVQCRKFDTWGISSENVIQVVSELRPNSYSELVGCVYEAHARFRSRVDVRWGDKNNFYIRHISELNTLFPSAHFIHIVRDPRDVACSYRALQQISSASPYAPNLPTDPDEIGCQWLDNVSSAVSAFSLLNQRKCTVVRYEDLVTSPQVTLSTICSQLGIVFDHAMLQFHSKNRLEQLEPRATMDWKQKTVQPIDAASVSRFRELLSHDDIIAIENSTNTLMTRFGYSLYGRR